VRRLRRDLTHLTAEFARLAGTFCIAHGLPGRRAVVIQPQRAPQITDPILFLAVEFPTVRGGEFPPIRTDLHLLPLASEPLSEPPVRLVPSLWGEAPRAWSGSCPTAHSAIAPHTASEGTGWHPWPHREAGSAGLHALHPVRLPGGFSGTTTHGKL